MRSAMKSVSSAAETIFPGRVTTNATGTSPSSDLVRRSRPTWRPRSAGRAQLGVSVKKIWPTGVGRRHARFDSSAATKTRAETAKVAIRGNGLDDVIGVIAKGRSKTGQYGFAVPIEYMDELYIDVSDYEHDPFFWSVK